MSPLNRGPLLGPRLPPVGIRSLPPPRFGARLPPPGMPPRMLPMSVFGPMRQRLPPPPRPGGGPLPLFPPRGRGMSPMVPPMVGMRGTGPRGPLMQPWPRRVLPRQILAPTHMRPRYTAGNGTVKGKVINNAKKVIKLEELELKKPWMTDEIRSEIQKKNKLYAKAKKNKNAKEWEEFKDLRNKVTRMIRDAKNEYLAKHPEQGGQKTDDKNTNESEGVQKTENVTEQSEQMEQTEETQPSSKQADLYPDDEESNDQKNENYISADDDEDCMSANDDENYYCEVCDRNFLSEDKFTEHKNTHKLCGIDNCTFSAHPLLVEKHIRMQHSSGLYQRMKNISTPEDIQKWIMERKKRYPTKANIEFHKAEELEKVQRGEIINKENLIQSRLNKKFNNRKHERKQKVRKRQTIIRDTSHVKEINGGIIPFLGTASLRQNDSDEESLENENTHKEICKKDDFYISDEEYLPEAKIVHTSPMPSLVANYESGSEKDEAPDEVPIKRIKICNDAEKSTMQNECSIPDIISSTSVSRRESPGIDVPMKIYPKREDKSKNITKQDRTIQSSTTNNKRHNSNRLQLLQRLLSRSVQHERNLICQCIKYIVDNNFFDGCN